jgi:flagellar basal-body rod protein FlgF
MDRMIYLAMNGAKALTQRQDALSNNLANANTAGFKADVMAFRAVPGREDGTATTRVYALEASAGFDAQSGPVNQTGRPLDVAIRGAGGFERRPYCGTRQHDHRAAHLPGERADHQDPGRRTADPGQPEVSRSASTQRRLN